MINNMNDTNDFNAYASRLKSRYSRDNSVLDLIFLIEKLRDAIMPKTDSALDEAFQEVVLKK